MPALLHLRSSADRARRALRGTEPYQYYLDLVPLVGRATLIVGSGRSGTTWLGEILDPFHHARSMFEPFRADQVPAAAPFQPGEYLDPGARDPIRRRAAQRILSGRVRSPWVDQFNQRSVATQRIVKEIRITNLVPWLRIQFPRLPILYLVRHPFAVANSATRLGWDDQLDLLFRHRTLFAALELEPTEVRARCTTPFVCHVVRWGLENTLMLRRAADPGVLMVSYEALVAAPDTEAVRIDTFLGRRGARIALDQPSATAWRSDSALRTAADPAVAWRAQVTADDARSGHAVLELFRINGFTDPGTGNATTQDTSP